MFNGSVPIILDSLKQHYFIDRDGKMFRHVLNFLRTGTLAIPDEFDEIDLLMEEARFFELSPLVRSISDYRRRQQQQLRKRTVAGGAPLASSAGTVKPTSPEQNGSTSPGGGPVELAVVDCVVMNVSPDLGERITLSADRSILDQLFPEIGSAPLAEYRGGWNSTSPLAAGDIDVVGCGPTNRNGFGGGAGDDGDGTSGGSNKAPGGGSGSGSYVIRFPLNGFCRLNSLQVMERLMSNGFEVCGSTGAGVEGQQFSEYVFRRKRRCCSATADLLPMIAPSASSHSLVLPVGHAGRSPPSGTCSDDEPLSLAPVIKRERLCD